MTLTIFSLSSIIGYLLGGRLADRVGHTRVAVAGFSAMIPLVPLLLMAQRPLVGLGVLIGIGICMATTYSPLIILGQQYLPNHIGLSSGVTLGVSVSIGGVAAPLLGHVADHHGLWVAVAALSAIPVIATGLACSLPRPLTIRLSCA
jgi:FSR family fosmidomycin resistance protein-like MFS transporter